MKIGTSLTAFLPFFMAATQTGVWYCHGVQQMMQSRLSFSHNCR